MNVWIPITAQWIDATGVLIAIGAAKLADMGGTAAVALEPLWQMSQAAFAGEAEVELLDGTVSVKARISQDLAATKTSRKVYRGFNLALLEGADGSTRICRVALADAPDAVTKGVGAEFLKLSRKPPVTQKSSILCARPEVDLMVYQARQRAAEETRLGKANMPPCAPTAAGQAQHNGLSTTAGGRGRDKAGYGEGLTGVDGCMAAIRQTLAQPFKESGGLIRLLGSRAA